MLNTSPGHLGDMKQTICAAQIYECTEIGNVLYNAFYNVTFMDSCEQCSLLFCLLGNNQLLAIADISSSLRIVLADNEFDLLICILRQIFLIGIGNKTCGDEDTNFIYNNNQTAIQYLCYFCFQNFMVVEGFFDSLVASVSSKSLVSQLNLSLTVIDFQYLNFHRVTRFYDSCQIQIGVIRIFVSGQNAVRFASDVQYGFFRLHINDCTFNYLSCMYCFQ